MEMGIAGIFWKQILFRWIFDCVAITGTAVETG